MCQDVTHLCVCEPEDALKCAYDMSVDRMSCYKVVKIHKMP